MRLMTGRWWIGVVAGTVLGLGAVIAVEASTGDASAQGGFQVSAEQLRINQRISQAAVRRSNEGLSLLDPVRKSGTSDDAPGWATAQIANNAITKEKLDPTLRDGQPRYAVVAATTGALIRGKGATAAAKLPPAGFYAVTFDRDISACAYQATIGDGATAVVPVGQVSVWRNPTDPKIVTVRTAQDKPDDAAVAPSAAEDDNGVPQDTNALPFHLTVLC